MSLGGGGASGAGVTYRPATPISRSAFNPYWNRERQAYAKRTGKAWPGPNPPGMGDPLKRKSTTSRVMGEDAGGGPGAPGRKSLTGSTLSFAGT